MDASPLPTTASKRFTTALLKCIWLMFVLGLGAILGILLLFKTGLYPGQMHYANVVGSEIADQKTLFENSLVSQMMSHMNRELFPISMVSLLRKPWTEYEPSLRDQWLVGTVLFKLTDAASPGDPRLTLDKISKALRELASASRFPKWEVISVSAERDREVEVKFRWNFKPYDIYSSGTDDILFDAMVRLRIIPEQFYLK